MSDALEEHDGKVRIGDRIITHLQSADDIDALTEEEQELEALIDNRCKRYKMWCCIENAKLMKTAPMASRGRSR